MLNKQSILSTKDNSKILKVKIINLHLKKKVKIKDSFLGVVKLSKSTSINNGSVLNFLVMCTKKKNQFISGKSKKSDINGCIVIKTKQSLEPTGTRFIGSFFSEIKDIKNQKIKNLINKCI